MAAAALPRQDKTDKRGSLLGAASTHSSVSGVAPANSSSGFFTSSSTAAASSTSSSKADDGSASSSSSKSSSAAPAAASLPLSTSNVLEALDAIVQSYGAKLQPKKANRLSLKAGKKEEEEKAFIASMTQLMAVMRTDKTSGSMFWPRLFYERMIMTQALSPAAQLEAYKNIFSHWLELVPPGDVSTNTTNRKYALAFLHFCSMHHMDPDNALLGIQASEKAIGLGYRTADPTMRSLNVRARFSKQQG
jgi:hypothetical protein